MARFNLDEEDVLCFKPDCIGLMKGGGEELVCTECGARILNDSDIWLEALENTTSQTRVQGVGNLRERVSLA